MQYGNWMNMETSLDHQQTNHPMSPKVFKLDTPTNNSRNAGNSVEKEIQKIKNDHFIPILDDKESFVIPPANDTIRYEMTKEG